MTLRDRSELQAAISELARNYRWGWHRPTGSLLDRVTAMAGTAPTQHPLVGVAAMDDAQWQDLVDDQQFCSAVEAQATALRHDLAQAAPRITAYFSPEFGVNATLPQYSGGLGILAGDHLKSASDENLPLVGIGLFYREGFFRQELTEGRQSERYEPQDPELLGGTDTGIVVTAPIGDVTAKAKVWRFDVGTIPLYLLDTDLDDNTPAVRAICDRLYSGDQEHRLRQELVLGIGGARAVKELGIEPTCFHLNEGHAGLLVLELIERALADGADSVKAALSVIRPQTLFTTHTPVPAGIDRFPRELFTAYVGPWAETNNIDIVELLDLGALESDGPGSPFNMAAFCLAAAGQANGVSKLHGAVSREMFASLPLKPWIGSVTNGVHATSWVSAENQALFDTHLGQGWANGAPTAWAKARDISPDDLRDAFQPGRDRLVALVAERTGTTLDPNALTVGFARRFATYKRANLILNDLPRITALLANDDHPVQFVFAGKAHPADNEGKALLHHVTKFAASADAHGRFVFVPGYDIAIAAAMYGGCDVWLNNPVRPMEACGTSGEKAALNGGLNASVRDGWWDEMTDGQNGWDIPTSALSGAKRDKAEAASILSLFESEIVPLFYDGHRSVGRGSNAWMERAKHCLATLGPQVVASRMVRDYDTTYYRP